MSRPTCKASARKPKMIRPSLLFITALAASVAASAATNPVVGKWRVGTNYALVANPQAPSVPSGKVEVIEVFWYGCSHCYELDPTLEEWSRAKPKYIEFSRVPVMWGAQHRQHAKLFYTVQALR